MIVLVLERKKRDVMQDGSHLIVALNKGLFSFSEVELMIPVCSSLAFTDDARKRQHFYRATNDQCTSLPTVFLY